MRNALIAVSVCAMSTIVGVGVVSAFSDDSDHPGATGASVVDTAPQTEPRLGARARQPQSNEEVGVVAYRNRAGKRCFAAGTVRDGKVGAVTKSGAFHPLPLRLGGTCKSAEMPVGLEVRPEDGGTTIVGLADPDVTQVGITLGDTTVTAVPEDDGTFAAATTATTSGRVVVAVTRGDGEVEKIVIPAPPPLPSMDDVRAGAPKAG